MKDKTRAPDASKSASPQLLCGIGDSRIEQNHIAISSYPFQPACVFPHHKLSPSEISAVATEAYPPQLKIGKEIVFVSREYHLELKAFVERHSIATFVPTGNWDCLLEPYLDTAYTETTDAQMKARLAANGIFEAEIQTIQAEVGAQMYKYNFETMLWEWASLGLNDILAAMRALYSPEKFQEFYHRAMEIELRSLGQA